MLNDLRGQIDPSEKKLVENLNYCINVIQSNKLYEADIDYDDSDGSSSQLTEKEKKRPSLNKDIVSMYKTYSSSANSDIKIQSKRISGTAPGFISSSVF